MRIIGRFYKTLRRRDDCYFRTPNLYLATVLFAQGFPLVNVDRCDPQNCQFVFRDSGDLQNLVERFNSKKLILVRVHSFVSCWKVLRRKLAGERF